MKVIMNLILTIIFVVPASAQLKTLIYKGENRKYIIYTPKAYQADSTKAFPIVFNFHGGGMTMAEQMLYTQMNKTADKYNFIVVYPKGIKEDWNVGFGMSYKFGTDDIGFIDSLLSKLKNDYRVDSKKVFATGLSRGGFFCHRIASELSHKFSAIASVGGTLPDSVAYYQVGENRVGVMIVHGTSDHVVNYKGKEGAYYSANDTFKYWQKVNNLHHASEYKTVIDKKRHDETSIEVVEISNGGKTVSLFTVVNGGHTWAGKDEFNVGLPIGRTSLEIDLNEYIWSFFRSQRE